MTKNNFKTNTLQSNKKNFLNKITGIFICAVFLTGICSIAGISFFIRGISEKIWLETGLVEYVKQSTLYLCCLCIFVSLIKIAIDEKPFSNTLTCCIRMIAILFLACSVLIPRLPGYQKSCFVILSNQYFTLIDGTILLPGLLLFILSILVREGFEMQKELDEIL